MSFLDASSSINGRFLGKLRAEIRSLLTELFSVMKFDHTTGNSNHVTAASSATNPALGTNAGFLALTPAGNAFVAPVIAGDPAAPINGCVWYNSTTHKLRIRANGLNVDLH